MHKKIKRLSVLLLACLLLAKVLSGRLVDYSLPEVPSRCPPMQSTKEISADELSHFLKTWTAYFENKIDLDEPDKVSLSTDKPSQKASWRAKMFFDHNCWDMDRFFYVEQRVRSIVNTVYLKKHTVGVIEVLHQLMAQEGDQAKRAAYQEMINMQEMIANIEHVSDDEVNMVKGREEKIREILDGGRLSDHENE